MRTAFCPILALVIIGLVIIGCGHDRPRHDPAPRAASPSSAFDVVRLPAIGQPQPIDSLGQYYVAGGIRFERSPQITIAAQLYPGDLYAVPAGAHWLFVDEERGRVLRSDTFLGALQNHGATPGVSVELCDGASTHPVFMLGADHKLYSAQDDRPLQGVAIPDDTPVLACWFASGTHGVVLAQGEVMATRDAGRTWQRMASAADEFSDYWEVAALVGPDEASAASAAGRNRRARGGDPTSLSVDEVFALDRAFHRLLRLPYRSLLMASRVGMERCHVWASDLIDCDEDVFLVDEAGARRRVGRLVPTEQPKTMQGFSFMRGDCEGNSGGICVIDHAAGTATAYPHDVSRSIVIAVGPALLTFTPGARDLRRIELRTGAESTIALEGADQGVQGSRGDGSLLADGSIAVTLVGDRSRIWIVPPGGSSGVAVPIPDGVADSGWLDARRGLVSLHDGHVLQTGDGGLRWTALGIGGLRGRQRVDCDVAYCTVSGIWTHLVVPHGHEFARGTVFPVE